MGLTSRSPVPAKLTVVTQVAVQNSCKHQRLVHQGRNSFFIGLDADNTIIRERTAAWNFGEPYEGVRLHETNHH